MPTTAIKPAARKRKAVVPPKRLTAGMSLFDYLRGCEPPLEKKIAEIACIQTGVPVELRDDATQEIYIMWSNIKPDTKQFKPGQVASYAHRVARHACLRTRRELGSTVRLPGSAFRKRKDGSSYVTPGVLASALNWEDLESWFQTDDLADQGAMAGLMGADVTAEVVMSPEQGPAAVQDDDEAMRAERQAMLEKVKDELSTRQYAVMAALIRGDTYEEIMAANNIKKGILMRELNIAASIVGPLN